MHLTERLGPRSLHKVARDLGGVQAQVHSAAELQCAARIDGLAVGAVDRALWKSKTLVKTWMMRGTLHYLDPRDLPVWASASKTRQTWNKPYWQKNFGISASDVQRAIDIIPEALDGRCMTRAEIADEVHRLTKNKAMDDLLRQGWGSVLKIVAAEGLLCFGPSVGRNVTFARPDQWLKDWKAPPSTDEAIAEVCRRYLASHGPATREEFARWWGYSPPDASKVLSALGDEVVLLDREGEKAFCLRRDHGEIQRSTEDDEARLLPMFDAYTLAGLPHNAVVPKEHRDVVYRTGAWVSQVVCRGGRVVGVWTHTKTKKGTDVAVSLFRPRSVRKADLVTALATLQPFVDDVASVSFGGL